jgi:hypothetical protein
VYLLYQLEPTFKINDLEQTSRTGRYTSKPERKHFLHFCFGEVEISYENGKDIFLIEVLPSKYSGSLEGLTKFEPK